MLHSDGSYLLYPFSGRLEDPGIHSFTTAEIFINLITNTPPISYNSDNEELTRVKINSPWEKSFFNWNEIVWNPSQVLKHTLNLDQGYLPRSKNVNRPILLDNINEINYHLPKILKRFTSVVSIDRTRYVNQFAFWALVYIELILCTKVTPSDIAKTLRVDSSDNKVDFSAYNDIDYAMEILTQYPTILYTSSSSRFFIKLPAYGKEISLPRDNLSEGIIGSNLSYFVLWPFRNDYVKDGVKNYQKVISNLLDFKTEIVALHYYPAYNYEHYLLFPTIDDYINHQIHSIVRTYRAQIKLQSGYSKFQIERRGLYTTICSRSVLNYKNYIIDKFGPLYPYLNIVGGVPFNHDNSSELPRSYTDFRQYINKQFRFSRTNIINKSKIIDTSVKDKGLTYLQCFFTYPQMRDFISSRINLEDVLFNFKLYDTKVSTSNMGEDLETSKNPIINIEYPLGNPINYVAIKELRCDLSTLQENLHFSVSSNIKNWNPMYSVPLTTLTNVTLLNTDKSVLEVYRKMTNIRDTIKNIYVPLTKPQSIYQKLIAPNIIKNTLSEFTTLFFLTYTVDAPLSYTVNAAGELNVSTFPNLDGIVYTKPNASSLKLLSMVFVIVNAKGRTELLNRNSLLILGAKDEPVARMVGNLTHQKWSVSCIGADAEKPHKKGNILNLNLKATYDFIISDMDQSIGVTVKDISDVTVKLFRKCLQSFKHTLIFKLQYGLYKVFSTIRDEIIIYTANANAENAYVKARLFKHCWSKPMSLEYFVIVERTGDVNVCYTDDDAKAICNELGDLDVPVPFYQYVGSFKKFEFEKLMNTILSTTVLDDDFSSILSLYLNVCSAVSYGRVDSSGHNNIRIFGATNIQRIGLFLRNRQVLQSENLLGKPQTPCGTFSNNEYVLKAPREVLVFSDAQRFTAWEVLRALYSTKKLDPDLMVYDIGGRDYECNYLTLMTNDVVMKYTVYDKNEIIDVKRDIPLVHENVTQDKLNTLLTLGSVCIFNSFYMTFSTRADLETSLDMIPAQTMKKGAYVFLSFYVMNERLKALMVEFDMTDGTGCVAPDYKFTFGRYNSVATTSQTFVQAWIAKLETAGFDYYDLSVSVTDIVDSTFAHGYGFSIDALQMYQLFNSIQRAYLLVKK